HNDTYRRSPTEADVPFDFRAGETMQNVEPGGEQGCNDVRPIGNRVDVRVFDLEEIEPRQGHAGKEQNQTRREQPETHAHRAAIGAVVSILDVQNAEQDNW